MDKLDEEKLNFSFAGCGFMGIYHIGVASCLKEYVPPPMLEHKIAGASAGAMVAALLLCDAPLGMCTTWTLSLAAKARNRSLGPMHPSFNITDYLRKGLEEILPPNAHEICNGRLNISMTRVKDGKNVMVSEFTSRGELIQALLCSAFIPFWSGLVPPIFRGERYIDGAWTDNLPRLDKYTITVSPFAGRSDICPKDDSNSIYYMYLANTSIQFSSRNLYRISRIMFPPHPEKLSEICRQGFEDALAFLKRNELVNCARHLAVKSVLSRRTDSVLFNDDIVEEEDCETDGHCEHCNKIREVDRDLHPSVISALEQAIDTVNSSYVLYVKNTKPYRTFSVICSPLYLPLDLAVYTLLRFLKWLPNMNGDVRWLINRALWFVKLASGKVISGRHSYTAKFVCELAITEFQQTDIMCDLVQSQVLTSKTHIHDQRMGFNLELSRGSGIEVVHDIRERYLEQKHEGSATTSAVTTPAEVKTASLTKHHGQHPYSMCSHGPHSRSASRAVSRATSRASSRASSRRSSINEAHAMGLDTNDHTYVDTFDHCIQVADHTDAILAYYYTDEFGQLKATEIFKYNTDAISK